MKEMIKNFCSIVVSCGLTPSIPLGSLLGSSLTIPLLIVVRFADRYVPSIMMWFFLIFGFISLFTLYIATLDIDVQNVFVIDKIWGLLLSFEQIPFSIRMIIIGFCSFHLIRVCVPFLGRRLFGVDIYVYGGLPGVLLPSMLAGVVVNGLLHLVQWAAH